MLISDNIRNKSLRRPCLDSACMLGLEDSLKNDLEEQGQILTKVFKFSRRQSDLPFLRIDFGPLNALNQII